MIEGLKPYPKMKDSGVPWLGEVPEHWEVRPLGCIGAVFKGNGGNKGDEVTSGIPCVRYGDLYTRHEYFITRSKACVSTDRADAYTRIRYGDVLFAASGETVEDIGRSAVNLIEGEARCGGDVLVLRPEVQALPRFLGYAADSPASRNQKACMGHGFTVVHIYGSELKRLALTLPPLPEQAAIVRFLDHAERRIRRYIRAKQKLIKLLEELKAAIIHRAVTRGLDPNVRLKPSGVEWLGDVPEHWEVRRLKNVFRRIVGGSTPSSKEAKYWDGSVTWITPADVSRSCQLERSIRTITDEGLVACSAELVPTDSIVVTSRAPVGNVAMAKVQLCTNQGCKALVPNSAVALPKYCFFICTRLKAELQSLATGTTFSEISTSRIGTVRAPVPPLPEQAAIARFLDDQTARIDAAVGAARRQAALLHEYRTRLIADVVTGKLDVREAAARMPEEADEEPLVELETEDEADLGGLGDGEGVDQEGEE